jgi:hypothetical protein
MGLLIEASLGIQILLSKISRVKSYARLRKTTQGFSSNTGFISSRFYLVLTKLQTFYVPHEYSCTNQ